MDGTRWPPRRRRPWPASAGGVDAGAAVAEALPVGSASEVAAAAASGGGGGGAADSHLMSHVVSSFSGAARPMRRVTGTLFGHRKGRVALALQETPRCLPTLVIELAIQTNALLRELANPAGARIVLETERRAPSTDAAAGKHRRAPLLLDVAAWTMFCNGRKTGLAVRREATDDDLAVLETLRPVSMGAGVLPASNRSSSSSSQSPEKGAAAADDEVAYMRGCFDHFVGSRDSESLYMIAPQGGGTGPELAIFFVRL
uniref:Protein MIZU-KUSSEI 1 n=1 Tax=Oryza rufipogon TaxID=4529 RepID=A0A0E0QEX2_ORYRU